MTFARHVVDECIARCVSQQIEGQSEESCFSVLPSIVFLLHVPADQLQLRPCYQTIPLNGWSAIYVDAFCDGLLEADGRGAEAYDSSNVSDSFGAVDSGAGSAKDSISEKHSPKWMRVAFSLDSAPMLDDLRREFTHLAAHALEQAVQMIDFNITRGRKERLSDLGIIRSLPAYESGDKEWVLDVLSSRRYIMQTLTDSFSALWGRLLQHTVEENCKRVAMGCTSRGLVASVRASHKWLLSDFMLEVVKKDLAGDWALEALAVLPLEIQQQTVSPLKKRYDEEDTDAVNIKCHGVIASNIRSAVESDAVKATVYLLKGIVAIRSDEQLQKQMVTPSIFNCVNSKSCVAPRTPFYQSLVALLERLVPQSRQLSHRARSRESGDGEVNCNAAALRTTLLKCKLYKDVTEAVNIIEQQADLFTNFKRDFIAVTLEFAGRKLGHSEIELEALSLVAMTYPNLSVSYRGDVCRWLVLKEELQAYLSSPSRLLVATRGILIEGDIRDILSKATEGVNSMFPIEDDDEENIKGCNFSMHSSAPLLESADSNSSIIPHIRGLSVQRLWNLMFHHQKIDCTNQQHSGDISSWMQCMRNLQGIEGFGIVSLLSNEGSKALNRIQSMMFCIMTIVSNIVCATGLSFEHFTALEDINQENIFDLLHIALALLSNAATELRLRTAASSDSSSKVLSHSICICLAWLFSVPSTIIHSSPSSKRCLTLGFLGIDAGPHLVNADEINIVTLISTLSLSARCHYLDLLLALDETAEEQINILVGADSYQSRTRIHVPVTVSTVATRHPHLDAFHNLAPQSGRYQQHTISIGTDSIVFRTIHLSHLREAGAKDIEKAAEAYRRAANIVDEVNYGDSYLPHIRLASRSVILIDCAAKLISDGVTDEQSLESQGPVSDALKAIVQTAPGTWSLYFFSKLSNTGKVLDVLRRKTLLEMLSMGWLYCEPSVEVEEMVLPAKIGERQKATARLESILWAVTYGSALVLYAHQQEELVMGSPVAAVFAAADNALNLHAHQQEEHQKELVMGSPADTQHRAMEFVRMIATPQMLGALAMNTHIPVLVSMHRFLKDHLAYRLRDISTARTLLVSDAIERLPLEDRLVGRKLFREFLDAWENLRKEFTSFDICGGEVQAAGEIPTLCEKSTFVSMLVEVERGDVHESMPAMMLETRLLKLTSQFLSNAALVQLRANEVFNYHEFLAEVPRCEKISQIFIDTPQQLLLSGPSSASTRDDEYFNRTVACYSTWKSTSAAPHLPYSIKETPSVIYNLRLIIEKNARDNQTDAHNKKFVVCPHCKNMFQWTCGCATLTCGNPLNPHAGERNLPPTRAEFCGKEFNGNQSRIPAPVVGQPPLPYYLNQAEFEHYSASDIGLNAPSIPDVAPSTGCYEFDWSAIASVLIATLARGRLDFKTCDSFFEPLAFAVGDDETTDLSQPGYDGGDKEGAFLSGVGNVFTRLLVAVDMVTESLPKISSSVSVIQFSVDTELTGLERRKIHNLAKRLDEGHMENLCEEALALCLGMLQLISQDYFEGLSELSSTLLPPKYLAKNFISNISLVPGMKSWSQELLSLLEFPLGSLSTVLKYVAQLGTEGIVCCHLSLCTDLPEDSKKRLMNIQDKVVIKVIAAECDVNTVTTELQTISSLLTDSLDSLLNDTGDKLLTKVTAVEKYLKEHQNELANLILPKLKIKHYGAVVRFLRQTLGLIAYHNLQAVQLSYSAKKRKESDEGYMGSESGIRHAKYKEKVPSDWEALQNIPDEIIYPEFSVSAPVLLLEHELHLREKEKRKEESIDEDWMICTPVDCEINVPSCEIKVPSCEIEVPSSDDSTRNQNNAQGIKEESATATKVDYSNAWAILTDPFSCPSIVPQELGELGTSIVSQELDILGVSEADSLKYLDAGDIARLSDLLKKVPGKKFRLIFGFLPK